MSRLTAQQLVEEVLAASTADGCVAYVVESTEANLRWASNSLTTNGAMRSRQVVVVSFVDGGAGMAAGTVARTGTPDVTALVAASEQAARDAGPAEDAVPLLSEPPAGAGDWDADPAETSIEVFAEFAPALGEAFGGARDRGDLLFGYAEHSLTTTYLGTSTGLRLRHDQPSGRVELNGKSTDFSRSVWAGVGTRDFRDVSVPDLAADVERKLGWSQRRVDLPAGRYETLLPPSAVSDLMLYAYWTMEARDADEGRNVFARPGGGNRIGDRLAQLPLTLRSDPAEPGLEAAAFQVVGSSSAAASVFDNGMATPAVDWIRDGVLTNLVRPRAWALKTTAPAVAAVDNLVLEAPDTTATQDEMVAATDRGLLLTTLWYIREVDPQTLLLTGLTRDGVFLVEGGEVTGAVNNFRWNESPVDLLGRISQAGRTERTLPREWNDWFTRAAMPPVRVPDFNMSSVSPAS
ncbi:Predicted Zn-dependent protease or its inactivated homolog [Geodermatophilus dictyosporus]|uniref:Predicted Zn-dependent protease or its inactivated homolog n=1 Tax=Geodermatophilus dictyosporus TaxID=1523247 RepID=A0A1I5UN50_9ACTN|nr:metallopeptidase TldD-related protein [Geodermatophilus dictyosporus]SFP96665.1 Predicted Zn-dependent protease or its inactivated homolog [Geodermatophilus dictyosporus]